MKTIKLAADISSFHLYTGWYEDGHLSCECNSLAGAMQHSKFVRNNTTNRVYEVMPVSDPKPLRECKAEYVNPCLACGSLDHRTYACECPKAAAK